MSEAKHRKIRFKRMQSGKMLPFDLDFLRELGFEFGLDWDMQLIIERPESVDIDRIVELLKYFAKGIETRLYFEGQKAKSVFVGGPLNGKAYSGFYYPHQPICHHIKRGEWVVYKVKDYDDPRAWYIGTASSNKKAKML